MMVKYKITFTTVCSLLLVWLIKVYADNVILQIAREYRDGTSNVRSNIGRAARYYEVIIDQVNTVSTEAEIAIAAIELADILETEDLTIVFSNHSYLELLMRAAEAGNGDAQHRLSVMYATGVAARDLIPMDSGRAIFLEYMSALSGNPIANMGMGYRYSYGIGLVKSCEKALPFYEYAANHVAEYLEAHGNMQYPDKRKLSDASQQQKEGGSQELTEYYSHLADGGDDVAALMLGNMYLSGTRVVSMNETTAIKYLTIAADKHNVGASGILGYTLIKKYIKSIENYYVKGAIRMKHTELEGIIALLKLSAGKHEVNGVVGLSLAQYHGVGVPQNISHAIERLYNFMSVHADAGFYLGEICMGMKPLSYSDEVISKSYKQHHKHGYAAIELNEDGAMQAYMISAQLGNTMAQHRLGHLFLGRGGAGGGGSDRGRSNSGTNTVTQKANCANAMKHFKSVTERGPWMVRLRTAQQYYSEGKHRAALFEFIQLAAVGVEVAQYNAAYMLSKCASNCPPNDNNSEDLFTTTPSTGVKIRSVAENTVVETNLGRLLKYLKEMNEHTNTKDDNSNIIESVVYINNMTIWKDFLKSYEPRSLSILATPFTLPPSLNEESSHNLSKEIKQFRRIESETRALILFDLSAMQGNAESYLLLGDIYYYNKAGLIGNEVKKQAAGFYRQAAEMRETQAIFNLGLMHQAGDGVAQDFHLAKRYYDQAANFDNNAKVPRDIALFMLEGQKVLNTWFGIETYSQILDTKIYIPSSILKYSIFHYNTTSNYQESNKEDDDWCTVKDILNIFYQLDVQFQEKLDYLVNKYYEVIVFPINYYIKNLLGTISFYWNEFMNYIFPTKHYDHSIDHNNNNQDRDATTIIYELKSGNSKLIKTQENDILSILLRSIENIYIQSRDFLISLRLRVYIGNSTLTIEQYEQFFTKEEFLILFSTIVVLILLILIKIIRRQIIITFQQRNN